MDRTIAKADIFSLNYINKDLQSTSSTLKDIVLSQSLQRDKYNDRYLQLRNILYNIQIHQETIKKSELHFLVWKIFFLS